MFIIYYLIFIIISKEIYLYVFYFMLYSNEDWMGLKEYVIVLIKVYIFVYRRLGLEIKKMLNWIWLFKNCKIIYIVWKIMSKCSC